MAFLCGILEFIALGIEIGSQIFWGFIGDKYGKKLAINCCTILYIIGALVLGFATSIVHLIISKLLFGLGAGKTPNFKGYAHQVTDNTNIQEFVKYVGLTISISFFIGPILCGSLSNPSNKFGGVFSNDLFISKPYLLPAIV